MSVSGQLVDLFMTFNLIYDMICYTLPPLVTHLSKSWNSKFDLKGNSDDLFNSINQFFNIDYIVESEVRFLK